MRTPSRLRRAACMLPGLLFVLASPGLARACAVCGGGNPANRFAFFATTVVLSLLPLGMFVGGFLWLRSRLARGTRDEFLERDSVGDNPRREPAPAPGPQAQPSR
jgi:hypothetical protein